MTALKIVTGVPGLAFLTFGYFIFFRKKYGLINGFRAEHAAGRRDERYARRVGLTEFIVGAALTAVWMLLMIFA